MLAEHVAGGGVRPEGILRRGCEPVVQLGTVNGRVTSSPGSRDHEVSWSRSYRLMPALPSVTAHCHLVCDQPAQARSEWERSVTADNSAPRARFRKRSAPEPVPRDPESLFGELPRSRRGVGALWSHQADLLRTYAEDKSQAADDLALELPNRVRQDVGRTADRRLAAPKQAASRRLRVPHQPAGQPGSGRGGRPQHPGRPADRQSPRL